MKHIIPLFHKGASSDGRRAGFTLVELLIVIVMTAIIGAAVVTNYVAQSKSYTIQREMANMQQNLRAAMYMLQDDIRNSGRDPLRTGRYGIQGTGLSNIDADSPNGYPMLTLTSLIDTDQDGIPDTLRTIIYQVMDNDLDGRRELRRQETIGENGIPGNWELIFDGLEDIGFAFAYDNGAGDLARFGGAANNPEIWAIDSNGNNDLDTSIDSNGDGDINVNDNFATPVNPAVDLNRIRVVRIWLLARSRTAYQDYRDTNTYVLGRKQLNMTAAANANRNRFRHLLLTGVVGLQNFMLDTNQ